MRLAAKRAVLAIALAVGLSVGGANAQAPSDEKAIIPPRSIQLTAEQSYVIKEIVLKDMHVEQYPRSSEIKIGDKVQSNIELQTFPPIIAEKVPQIKIHKFFVTDNQIVIVNPQDSKIADIIK